mmetsp:Transcript_3307/g.2857  ORF Transcript_3307/g.2857 Transcript_3307/m.2857 type:complete len:123 (-) Transcript_3307:2055-2423(-)
MQDKFPNVRENIFLSNNDGTLIDSERVVDFPILTFNSGPNNSLIGASELCRDEVVTSEDGPDYKNALVLDIGGTTSDIAALVDGFPRPASSYVYVAGVRTNFRMPDTISAGLGGGSYVKFDS